MISVYNARSPHYKCVSANGYLSVVTDVRATLKNEQAIAILWKR